MSLNKGAEERRSRGAEVNVPLIKGGYRGLLELLTLDPSPSSPSCARDRQDMLSNPVSLHGACFLTF